MTAAFELTLYFVSILAGWAASWSFVRMYQIPKGMSLLRALGTYALFAMFSLVLFIEAVYGSALAFAYTFPPDKPISDFTPFLLACFLVFVITLCLTYARLTGKRPISG